MVKPGAPGSRTAIKYALSPVNFFAHGLWVNIEGEIMAISV